MWVHERPREYAPILKPRVVDEEDEEATMKYVNYVSHVGPFAYEPPVAPPPAASTVTVTVPSQPSPTPVDYYADAPSNPAASMETTMPVMDVAAANASTVTPTSMDESPTTVTMESGRSKNFKSKIRAKVHKSGKKEEKEKRGY